MPGHIHYANDPDLSHVPTVLTEQIPIVEPVRTRTLEFVRGGGDSARDDNGECTPDCPENNMAWSMPVHNDDEDGDDWQLNANRIARCRPPSGCSQAPTVRWRAPAGASPSAAAAGEEWRPISAALPLLGWGQSPAREVQAMKWQSIETAPKDGTPVLLYFRETSMRIGCWKDRGPYGTGWRDPVGHAEQATLLGEPTHWMALPEPPAGAEKSRKAA